jgi:spermidine synthase
MMQELIGFIVIIVILLIPLFVIRRKKLKEYHSDKLGLIEVWQKYNGEKILTINKYPHGISIDRKSISKSYWYFIAKEALHFIHNKRKPEILFFGLGANTSSQIINNDNPTIGQTIIEFDKNIIQACRDYFHLDEMKHTQIILGDAYKLIDKRPDFNKKFDVVVVDIFTGIPPFVSTTTNKPSFVQKVVKWIKKDGMIIFNRPANIAGDREDTKKLVAYLKTLFRFVNSTYIKDPRRYKNDVVTAAKIR